MGSSDDLINRSRITTTAVRDGSTPSPAVVVTRASNTPDSRVRPAVTVHRCSGRRSVGRCGAPAAAGTALRVHGRFARVGRRRREAHGSLPRPRPAFSGLPTHSSRCPAPRLRPLRSSLLIEKEVQDPSPRLKRLRRLAGRYSELGISNVEANSVGHRYLLFERGDEF